MLKLADARRIIAAAEKKAVEIGQPMNIAVVDEGANLIGAIGVSGGSGAQDHDVAEAGASAHTC